MPVARRARIGAVIPLILLLAACTDTPLSSHTPPGLTAAHFDAQPSTFGYLDGWLDGQVVKLQYTRSFFCAQPPTSGAPTGCEIGAPFDAIPRRGPFKKLYAIAPVGFVPDVSTLACPPGSVCVHHPPTLDASRVAGPGAINIPGLPHSHIIEERGGGWRVTVNIRVRSQAVWDQIVAAKSLAMIRTLQADPAVGGAGLISQDTPTNIFFFIEVLN